MKTRDQERAEFAQEKVAALDQQALKKYKPLVSGFAAMIMNNGLGQALAYLKAKGHDEHHFLLNHLDEWLKKQGLRRNPGDALENIIKGTAEDYRLMTSECLGLLNWLKKFAVAEGK